jgi:ribosomal protein S18 acetylase RimI-like enzyme
MEIRPLVPAICDQVARLHLLYLSTPFQKPASHKLLSKYYQAVCLGKGAYGYTAVSQGELLGYVCGVWDTRELRKTLFHTHWLSLLWWGAIVIIGKPSLVFNLLDRFSSTQPANLSHKEVNENNSYELRPIVVVPSARGSGAAFHLVERLVEDARMRGFHSMHLFVEVNNIAAKRFYSKAGFRPVENRSFNGRPNEYFELDLS